MNKLICCITLALFVPAAQADLSCTMSFTMSGWSLIYKTANGTGTVTCSDNSSLTVRLHSEGGGLTAGQSSIDDGHGEFTGVKNIRDVLGSYVSGAAHGSAGNNGSGVSGLSKGDVNLSLKGKGHGFEVGVDVSSFVITAIPEPTAAQ